MINLRSTEPADAPFVFGVTEVTMRAHVEATWGAWNPERVSRESEAYATNVGSRIIQFLHVDCGLFLSEMKNDAVWVHKLYVLPEYQRRGIGRRLLAATWQEARTASLPLRLRVLKVNPAKVFYEGQGMSVYKEADEFLYMEKST